MKKSNILTATTTVRTVDIVQHIDAFSVQYTTYIRR